MLKTIIANSGLLNVDFGLAIWVLITFIIFFVILKRYAWKYISQAIETREKNISESLAAAEQASIKAEQSIEKNKELLAKAELEAQKIRQNAFKDAEKIREQRLQKTENEAHKLLKNAQQSIQNEKQKALIELRQEIANIAIQASSMIIDENMNKTKNHKLIDSFLSQNYKISE